MKTIKISSLIELPNNFTGIAEWPDETKNWYLDGQRHRGDGPAVEYPGGTKYWYLHGKLHHVDGPAIEHSDGEKVWYLNGEVHRIDGPAYTGALSGHKRYWIHGKEIEDETAYWLLANMMKLKNL